MGFSEKTQVFLIAAWYKELVSAFGERGRRAFAGTGLCGLGSGVRARVGEACGVGMDWAQHVADSSAVGVFLFCRGDCF